ncbi:MAG: glycosyltransferase [Desulfobulbaceae bacterium]|nr:glycosyltransferase [Desulfobulbaceae bacterium]
MNTSDPVLCPKVLLVGPSLVGGGAERRFTNIATHLFKGNSDVAVLTPGETLDHRLLNKTVNLGWTCRISYIKAIWLLRQRINQRRYDVLMAFGLFPAIVSIIANMLCSGDTKIIINEICRPKMETKNCKGWRRLVYNNLRKWFYSQATLITANSIDGLSETCELAGVSIERGVRVVNAIDTELLTKLSLVEAEISLPRGQYIVCVGRLDFMKRIDTVVDSFDRLSNRINCHLIIIGDGVARQALEAQVKAKNLQETVIFTGRLENPIPILKRSSALVLASEHEGFSNVILEAMFCDIPVITSLCNSDAREMCKQGAALCFEVGDASQLSEHIAAIVTEEGLGQKLRNCARVFRAPHALKQAIPIYEDLILGVAEHVVQDCECAN